MKTKVKRKEIKQESTESDFSKWADVIQKSADEWDKRRQEYFASHPNLKVLTKIAQYLYDCENDERYGDFKPKDLEPFSKITEGRRIKLLTDAETHFMMYERVKFVFEEYTGEL